MKDDSEDRAAVEKEDVEEEKDEADDGTDKEKREENNFHAENAFEGIG